MITNWKNIQSITKFDSSVWRWELYATAPDRVLETAVFTTVATLLSEHHDSRTLNRGFIYIIYIFLWRAAIN